MLGRSNYAAPSRLTFLLPQPVVVCLPRTQLRLFAAQEVMLWVVERRSMRNLGPLLFSTNLNGEKLHKVAVCRQTKATTRRVGIDLLRKGGCTLGNTFAKRKLDEGAS